MRLLAGVHQVVLLQVGQLGEAFVTGLTLEGSFSAVDPKMNLRVEEKSLGLRGKTRRRSEACPSLTFRLDSCPKVLLHTLHSYLILPFCFFSGYGSAL